MTTKQMPSWAYFVTEYVPEHPERTAYRTTGLFGENVTVKVFPSAGAMETCIRMQGRRASRPDDWHPVTRSSRIRSLTASR